MNKELAKNLAPGHSACAGCGMITALLLITEAAGRDVILTNATGCSEVTTSQYPNTFFKVPWMHGLFSNAGPLATGIASALKYKKQNDHTKVIVLAGDGATFDIGLGQVSGLWQRGDDVLYICYDNEAYQNTGYQHSGASPLDANTSTAPAGKESFGSPGNKKDMVGIALAHQVPYVATASVAYPEDLKNKVKKALTIKGSKYIQIIAPCIPGWGILAQEMMPAAKLIVQAGLYPIVEYTDGKLTGKIKIDKKIPVAEFLQTQGRFKHLFKDVAGKAEIKKIQKIADENIKKYGLI